MWLAKSAEEKHKGFPAIVGLNNNRTQKSVNVLIKIKGLKRHTDKYLSDKLIQDRTEPMHRSSLRMRKKDQ